MNRIRMSMSALLASALGALLGFAEFRSAAAVPACEPRRACAAVQDDATPKKGDADGKNDGKDGRKRGGKKGGGEADEEELEIADDVKDVPCRDLRALGDERKRYFLIGPRKNEKAPRDGFALTVVMPGGDGVAGFTSFVRRIWRECAPKDWLFAQLVSVQWTPDQPTIWPTRFSRVNGMEFTTEEYFAAVLEDVTKKQKLKIDPARVFQLGWSSGGPAEYAIALQEKSPVRGSYVAMSVFHEDELAGSLKHAKGQAFFLDHSPDDERCKFRFAELARDELSKAEAAVELVTYEGGHGWHGDMFGRLRTGFAWLDEQARAKKKP